ncbi:MAG: hypothetical protein R3C32_01895 [Chloroflexota bacterium]
MRAEEAHVSDRPASRDVRLADAPVNWGLFGLGSAPLLTLGVFLEGVVVTCQGAGCRRPGLPRRPRRHARRARTARARPGRRVPRPSLQPRRHDRGRARRAALARALRGRCRAHQAARPSRSSPTPPWTPPASKLADAGSGRHRAWLPPHRFETLVGNIHRSARIADAGLLPVVHPHAGGYIETDQEIVPCAVGSTHRSWACASTPAMPGWATRTRSRCCVTIVPSCATCISRTWRPRCWRRRRVGGWHR